MSLRRLVALTVVMISCLGWSSACLDGTSLVGPFATDVFRDKVDRPQKRNSWLPGCLRCNVFLTAPAEAVMLSPFWTPRQAMSEPFTKDKKERATRLSAFVSSPARRAL